MPFVLPVPPTTQAEARDRETAQEWEQAAPTAPDVPKIGPGGGPVTRYRTGPGDIPNPRDEWMGEDLYVVGRQGVMNGEQLFVQIPDPPPEGHGGFDPFNDGPFIDHSSRNQALFWSDWQASTVLGASGAGSFRGEHVVIVRIPPGSIQGYQPTDMVQANNDRALPGPWDTALTLGAAAAGTIG
jgi:hypothetical protein